MPVAFPPLRVPAPTSPASVDDDVVTVVTFTSRKSEIGNRKSDETAVGLRASRAVGSAAAERDPQTMR